MTPIDLYSDAPTTDVERTWLGKNETGTGYTMTLKTITTSSPLTS